MLKELINRVRGQVWLRVTCPYPERVLNLCSARKLAFWDLEWEGTETFTCRMSRGDHRILSRAAEKLDCTIEIVRREGAPYTLAKLRMAFSRVWARLHSHATSMCVWPTQASVASVRPQKPS